MVLVPYASGSPPHGGHGQQGKGFISMDVFKEELRKHKQEVEQQLLKQNQELEQRLLKQDQEMKQELEQRLLKQDQEMKQGLLDQNTEMHAALSKQTLKLAAVDLTLTRTSQHLELTSQHLETVRKELAIGRALVLAKELLDAAAIAADASYNSSRLANPRKYQKLKHSSLFRDFIAVAGGELPRRLSTTEEFSTSGVSVTQRRANLFHFADITTMLFEIKDFAVTKLELIRSDGELFEILSSAPILVRDFLGPSSLLKLTTELLELCRAREAIPNFSASSNFVKNAYDVMSSRVGFARSAQDLSTQLNDIEIAALKFGPKTVDFGIRPRNERDNQSWITECCDRLSQHFTRGVDCGLFTDSVKDQWPLCYYFFDAGLELFLL